MIKYDYEYKNVNKKALYKLSKPALIKLLVKADCRTYDSEGFHVLPETYLNYKKTERKPYNGKGHVITIQEANEAIKQAWNKAFMKEYADTKTIYEKIFRKV